MELTYRNQILAEKHEPRGIEIKKALQKIPVEQVKKQNREMLSEPIKEEPVRGKTAVELEKEYRELSSKVKPITMSSSEHMHGKWFPSKHKTYQPLEKQEYRNKVTEICPCCIGVLDLDEAASLGKLSSVHDHKMSFHEINPVPSGALGWFSSAIGGYFALAGLYFGSVNFQGSLDRNAKLKIIDKKNDANIQKVLKDPTSTNQELENLHAYKQSIRYSKFDGQYQKWGDGAMPAAGSAVMLGSLVYAPLTMPALGVMTGYALGHALKSGYDLHRHNKVDMKRLDKAEETFALEGKKIFEKRFSKKKSFYKKVITSYLSYGVGTAILGMAAVAGIASLAFPPALLAVGAVCLLGGVFSTVYYNNKYGRTYAPKNENHINRQMIGNDESILGRLSILQKQKEMIENYRKQLQNNVTKNSPWTSFREKLKTLRYYALTAFTLGVPHKVRGMKKKLKEEFARDIQGERLKLQTRDMRQEYFMGNLEGQIRYLENLKTRVFRMDLSEMKPYVDNSKDVPLENIRKAFVEAVNSELQEKKELLARLKEVNTVRKETYDFINTWDYLCKNRLIGSALEKFYDNLEDGKKVEEFEARGLITIKKRMERGHGHDHDHDDDHSHPHKHNQNSHENDPHHHAHNHEEECRDTCGSNTGEQHEVREYTVNMNTVLDKLNQNDQEAKEFFKQFMTAVDYTLLYSLDDELDYQKHEICNHLEDRLRK